MIAFEPLKRFTVCMLAAFGCVGTMWAQQAGGGPTAGTAEVSVRDVKFSTVRPTGGADSWLEAVVELDVRPSNDGSAYARFADRVQVSLGLGLRTREGEFDFFRASAEAVSLESGRAAFRFYLPPDVLKRERVALDPEAVVVDVLVRGRPPTAVSPFVSNMLRSPEALRSFRDRLVRAAPANDGILVPQYDSPFAGGYAGDTPTMVRRVR